MHVLTEPDTLTIGSIVQGWDQRSIRPDPEYQRGSSWSRRQQALLVDSILRGYPVPRLYFFSQRSVDPLGNASSSFYVIDGLQRMIAISDFIAGKFRLLDPVKAPDAFPPAIRAVPCPWASAGYADLDPDLRESFAATALPVVVIDDVSSSDEVRDLFIRLQAGTALTRQQVRDAWPGAIGPYVEGIGGKLRRQPRFEFISRLDRRGSRRDDEDDLDDPYHDARITAAQLLRLYLEGAPVTVDSRALDSMYHTQVQFDPTGSTAKAFERVLGYAAEILQAYAPRVTTGGGAPAKITKARLFSLLLTLADLDRAPGIRVDRHLPEIARVFWGAVFFGRYGPEPAAGRAASASRIGEHLRWLQAAMADAELTFLDPRRTFDASDRAALLDRAGGICELCSGPLDPWEQIDVDHRIPWIQGGRTELANGRAVHAACNRRRGGVGEGSSRSIEPEALLA